MAARGYQGSTAKLNVYDGLRTPNPLPASRSITTVAVWRTVGKVFSFRLIGDQGEGRKPNPILPQTPTGPRLLSG